MTSRGIDDYDVENGLLEEHLKLIQRRRPSVCLPACLPVCLYACLSVCLSVCSFTVLSHHIPSCAVLSGLLCPALP